MLSLVPRLDGRRIASDGDRFLPAEDRLSRRPGWPREGRARFFRRRVRETTQIVLDYAKLLLEMQELWLATRIRHEEYAFVGDLRALRTRAAAMLEVKANWARLHAVLAARLREWRTTSEGPAGGVVSAAMHDRFEAVRGALGPRADDLARDAPGFTWSQLRVPSLPPLRPRPMLGRLLARLNVVRAPNLEARRRLSAYWRLTERRLRSWQPWRLNPLALVWNAARDCKNLAIFLAVMTRERY